MGLKKFLSKSQQDIFVGIDNVIQKFMWKDTGPGAAKLISTKKNNLAGITLPYIKAHFMDIVIKTV